MPSPVKQALKTTLFPQCFGDLYRDECVNSLFTWHVFHFVVSLDTSLMTAVISLFTADPRLRQPRLIEQPFEFLLWLSMSV